MGRYRWLLGSVLAGLLVGLVAGGALAHLPEDDSFRWTCLGGQGHQSTNGNCYWRHSNANADWFPDANPPAAVVGRFRNGAGVWDQTFSHQFDYRERIDATSMAARWISTDPCGNTGWIACFHGVTSGGFIVEGSSYLHFESDLNWYTGTGTPGSTQWDLYSVASHEFGHALGLGHSSQTTATMWHLHDEGTVFQRSPSTSDRDGRCEVYGHGDGFWGGC